MKDDNNIIGPRQRAEGHMLPAGLSKGAAFCLLLLFLSMLAQVVCMLYTFALDIQGKDKVYKTAKVGILICQLMALLDSWFTRAVKWAILSQWSETRNFLRAYLGLAFIILRKVFIGCGEEFLLTEPAVKD